MPIEVPMGFCVVSTSGLVALDLATAADRFLTNQIDRSFRVASMDYVAIHNLAVAGEPCVYGIADGDLSSTEVEEHIEVAAGSPFDRIDQERSGRYVKILGIAPPEASMNGQFAQHAKVNWTFGEGVGVKWWAYNLTDSSFSAAGQSLKALCKWYGVWTG